MSGPIAWFARNNVAANLLLGVIVMAGLVSLAIGVGCSAETGDDPGIPAPEFGLGGKADGDLCDPAADLCWPTDQQAIQQIEVLQEMGHRYLL